MALITTADRCKETAVTTGTGAFTLDGAVAQFQSFATAFGAVARIVMYAIVGQTGTEWEVGEGTFNGTTGLTRNVVLSSSNANALVNFSAGTKDVFATLTAKQVIQIPASILAPPVNEDIRAGYSAVVVRKYTIASGTKLTIQSGASMRIL